MANETTPKNNTVKTLSLGIRLEHALVERLDAIAPRLSAAGPVPLDLNRSAVIRALVIKGLAQLERELPALPPSEYPTHEATKPAAELAAVAAEHGVEDSTKPAKKVVVHEELGDRYRPKAKKKGAAVDRSKVAKKAPK